MKKEISTWTSEWKAKYKNRLKKEEEKKTYKTGRRFI